MGEVQWKLSEVPLPCPGVLVLTVTIVTGNASGPFLQCALRVDLQVNRASGQRICSSDRANTLLSTCPQHQIDLKNRPHGH